MPIPRNKIEYALLLVIEWCLFLTLAVPFYHWAHSPSNLLVTLLVMGGIIAGGAILFSRVWMKQSMIYYYALCLVSCFVGWFLFSWPIFLSFGFSFFFFWRVYSFLEGQTMENRWWLYFLTFFIDIVLWFVIRAQSFHALLLIAMVLQGLSLLVFEMLGEWRTTKRLYGSLTYVIGFLSMLVLGVFATVLFPYVKWVLEQLLRVLILFAMLVAELIFYIVEKLLGPRLHANNDVINNLFKNSKKPPKNQPPEQVAHHFNPELLFILLVIVLIVVGYFLFRRWRLSTVQGSTGVATTNETMVTLPKRRSRLFDYARAPKDPIRLQVFQLQKKYRKQEKGRFKSETLSEWLRRLTNQDESKKKIQEAYEAVRYSPDQQVTEEEKRSFNEAMENLRHQLEHDEA